MAITEHELEQAEQRMTVLREAGHAVSARYDRRRSRVVVALSTGVELAFPTRLAEGLAVASPESLAEIEISPAGLGLHWPRLDADLYVPALLQGGFGSKGWMARQFGSEGGRSRAQIRHGVIFRLPSLTVEPQAGGIPLSRPRPRSRPGPGRGRGSRPARTSAPGPPPGRG